LGAQTREQTSGSEDTGEPDNAKALRPVREGADGKGPRTRDLAGGLPHYAWRGADARFLQRLRADFPDAQFLTLDQNFRSTGQIVGLANALAEPLGGLPPLWTDNPPGTRTLHVVTADERDEAAYVVSELARLLREGAVVDLGDVAVLYRTNRQAHELILALRARRLPYRVLGRGDLLA
jgi:superfamily I DNA/RNA helicase